MKCNIQMIFGCLVIMMSYAIEAYVAPTVRVIQTRPQALTSQPVVDSFFGNN